MYRIVSGITTLLQHIETLCSTPEVYRPKQCPNCGRGGLWCHGFYTRKADRRPLPGEERLPPVSIPRYLCPGCRRSCSRLSSCIAPHRWYGWLFQQQILQFLLTVCSLRGCSAAFGLCRSTVRRWWNRLKSASPIFEFFLRSRFPEWGRFTDFKSFWTGALSSLPLSEVMACLDFDGVTVP